MPISALLGLLYFLSEMGLQIFKRAKSGAGRTEDGGSLAVLWLVITASMFLAFRIQFSVPQTRWPWLPWVNDLGIALTLVGLAIRWYSIIYLGRYFTVNVAIATDHKLIDTGPYRTVRHPSYSGALLAFLGLAVCMQNWAALLILITGTTAAFLYRMRVEERALTGAFGDRYRQYQQRTARLIPGMY
jgi:protein-S-isoprenylcysteine O-methyltransferase